MLLLAALFAACTASGPQIVEPVGPQGGAAMLWYDGSIFAYDAVSDSWISENPVTYRMYGECARGGACTSFDPSKILEDDLALPVAPTGSLAASDKADSPIQDVAAAAQYCAFVRTSGVLATGTGYRCHVSRPQLFPPLCALQPAESEPESAVDRVRSAFCSGHLGGVTFDRSEPVTDASRYRVTSDGEVMFCVVVDGRLACTGGKAEGEVSISVCEPGAGGITAFPAMSILTPAPTQERLYPGRDLLYPGIVEFSGARVCPPGYVARSDGTCHYVPARLAGIWLGGPTTTHTTDVEVTPSATRLLPSDATGTAVRSADLTAAYAAATRYYSRLYTRAAGGGERDDSPAEATAARSDYLTAVVVAATEYEVAFQTRVAGYSLTEAARYGSAAEATAARQATLTAIWRNATAYYEMVSTEAAAHAATMSPYVPTIRARQTAEAATQTAYAPTRAAEHLTGVAIATAYRETLSAGMTADASTRSAADTERAPTDWAIQTADAQYFTEHAPTWSAASTEAAATSSAATGQAPTVRAVETAYAHYYQTLTAAAPIVYPTDYTCPPGEYRSADSSCLPCPPGMISFDGLTCEPNPYAFEPIGCPAGMTFDELEATCCPSGGCDACPAGWDPDVWGACTVPQSEGACPDGMARDPRSHICACPSGQVFHPYLGACVMTTSMSIVACPAGYYFDEAAGDCRPAGGGPGCYGSIVDQPQLLACYPAGCLAGQSFDPDLQCCRSDMPEAASPENCVELLVKMPGCDVPRRAGGGQTGCPPEPCGPNDVWHGEPVCACGPP